VVERQPQLDGVSADSAGWMLAIDTSSTLASLALSPLDEHYGTGGAELAWHAGRNQTATLLAQVDKLCRLCGIDTSAFAAVAIATGPGGFNALRVGMSVAKGFAFALDIPIYGIGTLDATALSVSHWGLPVRAFVPAGRGRAVYADYVHRHGKLVPLGEVGNRPPPALAEDLHERTVLVGELPESVAEALRSEKHVVLPSPSLRRRRASMLLDIAVQRRSDGAADDLVTLEPVYVHGTRAPEK
jgi:tRNA threonylcarbamoyladenosine biosynthesis protein TsaB